MATTLPVSPRRPTYIENIPDEFKGRVVGGLQTTAADTFSQTVHSRTSYMCEDIIWDAKFTPAFDRDEDGTIVLNLNKIGDFVRL